MPFDTILLPQEGAAATRTLNRPQALNSLGDRRQSAGARSLPFSQTDRDGHQWCRGWWGCWTCALGDHPDFVEGLTAFIQIREPNFNEG